MRRNIEIVLRKGHRIGTISSPRPTDSRVPTSKTELEKNLAGKSDSKRLLEGGKRETPASQPSRADGIDPGEQNPARAKNRPTVAARVVLNNLNWEIDTGIA